MIIYLFILHDIGIMICNMTSIVFLKFITLLVLHIFFFKARQKNKIKTKHVNIARAGKQSTLIIPIIRWPRKELVVNGPPVKGALSYSVSKLRPSSHLFSLKNKYLMGIKKKC